MSDTSVIEWLLENGGPIVSYRTAAELIDDFSLDALRKLQVSVLKDEQVCAWLSRLTSGGIHGSKDTAYENAMGKLLEFGLRSGMPPLDKQTMPLRRLFVQILEEPRGMMRNLNAIILAAGLARAYYERAEGVGDFLFERLNTLHDAIQRAGHDIYVDTSFYRGIPKVWQRSKTPLVNPELTPDGEFQLPYIYDIYALSAFPRHLCSTDVVEKIDAVLQYILSPKYQSFPPGYGLLQAGKNKYYAVGWNILLPGCRIADLDARAAQIFVQRVELMAHFAVCRKSAWFREATEHLESFRTATGRYMFPRRYLRELTDSYWITGGHMGLEGNRSTPKALELESTFRMLKIRRLMREDFSSPIDASHGGC